LCSDRVYDTLIENRSVGGSIPPLGTTISLI